MKTRQFGVTTILASGIIVVTLTALGLFWARWLCVLQRGMLLPESARQAAVDVSSLLQAGAQGEPNAGVSFQVEARMRQAQPALVGSGLLRSWESQMPGRPDSLVYRWEGQSAGFCVHYDFALGQMVYETSQRPLQADGTRAPRQSFISYAGPNGVADAPEERLGRFLAPVVERFELYPQLVYDRAVHRFFAIDWLTRTVRRGPELPQDGAYRPVQIRVLAKNLEASLIQPFIRRENDRHNRILLPDYFSVSSPVLILDASGRIDLFDAQTLHFVGTAGRLTTPTPFFGSPQPAKPEDVLAYEVSPIGLPQEDGSGRRTYGGCVAATLARDGTGMRLDVYDAHGQLVGSDETGIPQYVENARGEMTRGQSIPSAEAVYDHLPGGEILAVVQFTLESLHPPVLLALSHWAAPYLGSTAGYRSIFLLPDSFVAMSARDSEIGRLARFFRACLLVFPAVLLALQFAWFVARDGEKMGLSKNARAVWVAGTVLFGLPAYITYRLMRPKATLVTCTNCGKSRRPDMGPVPPLRQRVDRARADPARVACEG
jgi:hypothetical protein